MELLLDFPTIIVSACAGTATGVLILLNELVIKPSKRKNE